MLYHLFNHHSLFHFHLSLRFVTLTLTVTFLKSPPEFPRFYFCSPSQPRFQNFKKSHYLPIPTTNAGWRFKTHLVYVLDPTFVYRNLDHHVYLDLSCDWKVLLCMLVRMGPRSKCLSNTLYLNMTWAPGANLIHPSATLSRPGGL